MDERRGRPAGIVVIVVLMIVNAASIAVALAGGMPDWLSRLTGTSILSAGPVALYIAWGLLSLTVAGLLWAMLRIGWVLARGEEGASPTPAAEGAAH